jgi:hypothetical protein
MTEPKCRHDWGAVTVVVFDPTPKRCRATARRECMRCPGKRVVSIETPVSASDDTVSLMRRAASLAIESILSGGGKTRL